MTVRDVVLVLLRLGFGAMWVYAGAVKVADPTAFLADVRGFQILGDPWAALVALALPWVEVIAGFAVMAGRWLYHGSLVLLTGALVVFGVALASAWARGLDIDCGCFSSRDGAAANYPWWLARDALLIACALLLMKWGGCGRPTRPPVPCV
jgi:uncharacterized membrane protein YphA (DoxX/SURF4 family)